MLFKPSRVNNPGASSGALTYENKIERSKLRGIQPGRQRLMKTPLTKAALVAPILQRRSTNRSGIAIFLTPFRERGVLCSRLNGPAPIADPALLLAGAVAVLAFDILDAEDADIFLSASSAIGALD
jgi:hypothetical protein